MSNRPQAPQPAIRHRNDRRWKKTLTYAVLLAVFLIPSWLLFAQSPLPVVGDDGASEDATIRDAEELFWQTYHARDYGQINAALKAVKNGLQHAENLLKAATSDDAKAQAKGYRGLMHARSGWLHLWRASEYQMIPVSGKVALDDTQKSHEHFFHADNDLSSLATISPQGPLQKSFNAWQPTLHMAVDGFRAASTYAYGRSLVLSGASLVESGNVDDAVPSMDKGGTLLTVGKILLDKSIVDYPAFNGYTHAAVTQTGTADLEQNLVALLGILKGCESTEYGELFQPFKDFVKAAGDRLPAAAATKIPSDVAHLCVNSNRVPHNFEAQMMALGDLMLMAEGQSEYKIQLEDVAAAWQLATTQTESYALWPDKNFLEQRLELLKSGKLVVPQGDSGLSTLKDLNDCSKNPRGCQSERVQLLRSKSFQAPGCTSCHQTHQKH